MKRGDLKVGEVYAWTRERTRLASPVKVLNTERLYERQTPRYGRRSGPVVPSSSTVATRGVEYPYIEVGILVEHESGQRALVNPAHIRAPWTEWQTQNAALAERRAESDARKQLEDVKAADTRHKLTAAIAASPWAKRLRTGYAKQTTVDNEVLLEIVEVATAAFVEYGWEPDGDLPTGLPDELVIDDDGQLAGIVRPATTGDYDLSKFNSADRPAAGDGGWSTYITPAVDTTYASEDVYPDA